MTLAHDTSPARIVRARRVTTLAGPDHEAFAAVGGMVVATGTPGEMAERFPDAERVDLGDAYVVPGFNDAHCHPSGLAETKLRLDLMTGDTATSPRARIAARAAATPPGRWIVVERYDARTDPEGRLDRAALDAITREHPVVVVHFSYHMAVANSAGLELAGVRDGDTAPVGGDLGRDPSGNLDGWLYERAWFDQWYRAADRPTFLPEADPEALLGPLGEVFTEFHAAGITSYTDALTGPKELRLYQLARERGGLSMRIGLLVWYRYLAALREAGVRAGLGDEWIRVVGVKMMADGALAGGTCLCAKPYAAETGGDNGIQFMSDEELGAMIDAVHGAGLRAAVHANGDRAIANVLDAVERSRAAHPHNRVNHRIEHCSLVDASLIGRIHAAGVTPVPFGSFVHDHGAKLRGYYGDERARRACAHRDFLDAGVPVAGSSDFAAGPLAPLLAIRTMVTRLTADGDVLGPEQRLTVRQALEVYTIGSAHASGEAHLKGRIAPGMLADFTVLGADPFAVDPRELADVPILSTWVGGGRVWSAHE
jgi:predicted amidohydrolase YtcJ